MVRSPQLRKQWELYEEQEYQRAFEEARALLVRLHGPDRRDAYRLVGLACHQQKQYSQATFWLRKACEGSDDAGDWLNLALAATMQGNHELGAEAFEQVRICQQVARYGQHPGFYLQLYWYACALYDKAAYERLQSLLDELADVYRRLHRTDTNFLYARRLPFLSSVLILAMRHFAEQEKRAEGVAWLHALGEKLDEEGQRQVNQAILDLMAGDEQPHTGNE